MNQYLNTRLAKNSIIYLINQVYLKLCQFAIITVLVNFLSVKEYGYYGLIIVFYRFLPMVFSLGFSRGIGRLFLEDDRQNSISNTVTKFILFVVIISGLLIFIVVNIYQRFFETEFSKYILPTFLLVSIATFSEFFLSIFKIKEKAKEITFSQAIIFTIQLLLLYILGKYMNYNLTLVIYMLAFTELLLVLMFIFLKPFTFNSKFDFSIIKNNLYFSLPFIIYGGAVWIFQLIDRWTITFFRSIEEVAWYTLAFQLGNLVIWLAQPFNQAIGPRTERTYVNEGHMALNNFHNMSFTFFLILGLLTIFGVSFFGFLYIKYIAPVEYLNALTPMYIIIAGGFFRVVYLPYINIIRSKKETRKVATSSIFSILLNLILNITLIPFWGIVGAAVATLISHFILLLIYYRIVLGLGVYTKIIVVNFRNYISKL